MSITGQEITYEELKEATADFEGRDFAQWMIDNIDGGVLCQMMVDYMPIEDCWDDVVEYANVDITDIPDNPRWGYDT